MKPYWLLLLAVLLVVVPVWHAVWEYLKLHPEFKIDKSIEGRLGITSAPDGWLKRVR